MCVYIYICLCVCVHIYGERERAPQMTQVMKSSVPLSMSPTGLGSPSLRCPPCVIEEIASLNAFPSSTDCLCPIFM